MLLLLNSPLSPEPVGSMWAGCFRQTTEMEMKAMIAGLALFSLAAGPVFAAGAYIPQSAYVPPSGYYGFNPNSPALTGGGSLGHNQLQQRF